jgi:hypothetical protein
MDTQPAISSADLLTVVINDVASAIAERHGETPEQRSIRFKAASGMIKGFRPRDAIEAMLASQCVMLQELMIDNVRHAFGGEAVSPRPGPGGTLVGMSSAFRGNLNQLRRYRQRPSEGQPIQAEPRTQDAQVETKVEDRTPVSPAVPLNRAARRQAARAQARAAVQPRPAPAPMPPAQTPGDLAARTAPDPSPPARPATLDFYNSDNETIAACRANPEAMAALEAGDAARFAKAMGFEQPSAAFLAAAAVPGSPFDRNTEYPRRNSGEPDQPST